MFYQKVPSGILALTLVLSSCTGQQERELPKKEYRVADRQLPADATYSRLRWVHLPETHPQSSDKMRLSERKRSKLLPTVHISLKETPICDAAKALAELGNYHHYCSSLIKKESISINALGTIDEFARKIEANHSVRVIIDHTNREVRFLSDTAYPARFFDEDI